MIDSVRQTVLAVANKNNYGYISPGDFNLFAQQAQLDIFEDYFYQYNQWLSSENLRTAIAKRTVNNSGYADINKGLLEVMDSFSAEVFLDQTVANLNNANLYSLPSDYYFINKIFYYPAELFNGTTTGAQGYKLIDGGQTFSTIPEISPAVGSIVVNTSSSPISKAYVTAVDSATTLSLSEDIMAAGQNYVIYNADQIREVERVTQNKIFYLTSSSLTAPTTEYPSYVLGGATSTGTGNTVTVYPSTIRQKGAVQTQYIRYPLTPKWTYTNVVTGAPVFDPTKADYQDFELPSSDEPDLVNKILQFAGISIREGEVYKFGQVEEAKENQEEVAE